MNKFLTLPLVLIISAAGAFAGGPSVWSINSRAEVLRGDARGVSIDDAGAITLAPKLTELLATQQPYIWSSVIGPGGDIFLGTGGDGKIFTVNTSGRGWLYADLPELNVTALAIGKNRELFAATSPDGKVYKITGPDKAEVYFDAKQKYIWSLAVLPDGSLVVGTGESGRIYKVASSNASPDSSLLTDTSETHIISLAVDSAGNIFAGTDPGGLVLKIGSDGKPFALVNSPLREIHDLAVASNGSIYALALGESVAAPKPPENPPAATAADSKPSSSAPNAEPPAKSRYDLSGARSAVYRILPDGGSDMVWASATITAFSLNAQPNGVLIGTSDKGRIYRVSNDSRETLVLQTDANQISTIVSSSDRFIATSSNPGSLYRIGSETLSEGTYESSVLDAKADASWGRIWWQSTGNVQLQTRSGNTEKPDETWSQWKAASSTASSGQVTSPTARFLQWRAILHSGQPNPKLSEVNVAYQPRNIAPEVLSIQVLPTNVGLVPNPAVQIDPNIALSGLDPSVFGAPVANVVPRRVYQRGATSLQWTAEDRNGDKLVYDVLYKGVNDTTFRPLRENISEAFTTIDGQSLADGRYVFKIVAKDTPSNPSALALSGDRTTDPIDIDNTPPTVTAGQPVMSADTARVTFTASDKASYLTKAEFSVNGGEWQTVYADDGISDSPEERYTVELSVKAGSEYVVTLRVFDVNGNSGNARAVIR
jgi:hypothetical protein